MAEKALDGLLSVEAKIDERHRLVERLKTQKWTASEAEEWRAEIIRLGDDAFVSLSTFNEYIEQAASEGRYTDDLSPSWRNVRAKVDPKLWVVPAVDVVVSMKYARALDAVHEPRVTMIRIRDRVPMFDLSTGFYGMGDGQERLVPRAAQTWQDACNAWARDIEAQGGVSGEFWAGVCAEEALPPWANDPRAGCHRPGSVDRLRSARHEPHGCLPAGIPRGDIPTRRGPASPVETLATGSSAGMERHPRRAALARTDPCDGGVRLDPGTG